jgi:hypothetical protein
MRKHSTPHIRVRIIFMPQLTGLQTGTEQGDSFIGSLDVITAAADAGILNATVKALGGNDTIEGSAKLVPTVMGLTLTATGISQSQIEAGSGDDTVLATGIGAGFFEGFALRGPRYSGTGIGYGVSGGLVTGGDGNDNLSFSGTGKDGRELIGIGALATQIEGAAGADTITINGIASGSSDSGVSGTATGAANATVSGGDQRDVIGITATAQLGGYSGSFPALVKGVDQGFINGDGGDDSIAIAATGRGTGSTVSAISQSQVKGGGGNDTLSLTSKSDQAITRAFSTTDISLSVGADSNSLIQGGLGNDVITLTAEANGANANAYGASGSQVQGGNGSDKITLSAKGGSFGRSTVFAALNAQIDGGADNDVIELSATTNSQIATAASANKSTIRGGGGDDTLLFKFIGTAAGGSATGILESKIYGDSGNDTIRVEAAPFASFDIVDSLIFGGAGDDTFDVGIGKGTIQGDTGNDTAILNYLNAQTMDVVAIADGIQISGSQTKSGTAGEWKQDILGIERFQVGDTVYSAADLVAAFGP